MSAFGDLSHANIHRAAALGGVNCGNFDLDDSEVVELHRRDLLNRDRDLGTGANVTRRETARARRWLSALRTAKGAFAERRTCRC